MLLKCVLGGIVGGIILFAWSFISWTILPWHNMTLFNFKSDPEVVNVMKTNVAESGMYFLPKISMNGTNTLTATPPEGPTVFAAVHLEGMPSMQRQLITGLITQIVAAFFVTALLLMAAGATTDYGCRVGITLLFGIAASIVGHVPYWNWFQFDSLFTLIEMSDVIIGWFLAGLALAAIAKR